MEAAGGAAARAPRIGDARLAVDQLEHAAARRERRTELACYADEGLDGVERGKREQGQHRDQHAVELPARVRRHGQGEHADNRPAGDCDLQAVADSCSESVAAADADERLVSGLDPCEPLLLLAVDDELRGRLEGLHELGGQLAPRGGLAAGGAAARARRPRAAPRRPRRPARRRGRARRPGGTRQSPRPRLRPLRARRAAAERRAGGGSGARRRRRPSARGGPRGGSRRARRGRAARSARRRARARGRGRGRRGRETPAARGSGRSVARARRSGRPRSRPSATGRPDARRPCEIR